MNMFSGKHHAFIDWIDKNRAQADSCFVEDGGVQQACRREMLEESVGFPLMRCESEPAILYASLGVLESLTALHPVLLNNWGAHSRALSSQAYEPLLPKPPIERVLSLSLRPDCPLCCDKRKVFLACFIFLEGCMWLSSLSQGVLTLEGICMNLLRQGSSSYVLSFQGSTRKVSASLPAIPTILLVYGLWLSLSLIWDPWFESVGLEVRLGSDQVDIRSRME